MRKTSIEFKQLASEVSTYTGIDIETILKVLRTSFDTIAEHLDQRRSINILRFGTFSVEDDEHGFAHTMFTPSHIFKEKLRVRPEMNKYSVVLNKDKIMTAKLTGKCPVCRTDLESKDPPKCPKCGTEPFEETEK